MSHYIALKHRSGFPRMFVYRLAFPNVAPRKIEFCTNFSYSLVSPN